MTVIMQFLLIHAGNVKGYNDLPKPQFCFWYNFAVEGLNKEITFSSFLKRVRLRINIFCYFNWLLYKLKRHLKT